jgi:uncharacterized integral membrane protein (TIGR00698 family)
MHGGFSGTAFGIYTGSTVHEVAQVVAAGRAVSEQAANMAVIAKMVRVMMLAPFLIALSAYLARRNDEPVSSCAAPRARIVIPWFAFAFVAVAGINSLSILPASAVHVATAIDTMLLAMAMAALGLTTHVSAIRKAGIGVGSFLLPKVTVGFPVNYRASCQFPLLKQDVATPDF